MNQHFTSLNTSASEDIYTTYDTANNRHNTPAIRDTKAAEKDIMDPRKFKQSIYDWLSTMSMETKEQVISFTNNYTVLLLFNHVINKNALRAEETNQDENPSLIKIKNFPSDDSKFKEYLQNNTSLRSKEKNQSYQTFIKAIRVMDLYSLSDTICLSLDFLSDNSTFLKIFDNLTDHKIFEQKPRFHAQVQSNQSWVGRFHPLNPWLLVLDELEKAVVQRFIEDRNKPILTLLDMKVLKDYWLKNKDKNYESLQTRAISELSEFYKQVQNADFKKKPSKRATLNLIQRENGPIKSIESGQERINDILIAYAQMKIRGDQITSDEGLTLQQKPVLFSSNILEEIGTKHYFYKKILFTQLVRAYREACKNELINESEKKSKKKKKKTNQVDLLDALDSHAQQFVSETFNRFMELINEDERKPQQLKAPIVKVLVKQPEHKIIKSKSINTSLNSIEAEKVVQGVGVEDDGFIEVEAKQKTRRWNKQYNQSKWANHDNKNNKLVKNDQVKQIRMEQVVLRVDQQKIKEKQINNQKPDQDKKPQNQQNYNGINQQNKRDIDEITTKICDSEKSIKKIVEINGNVKKQQDENDYKLQKQSDLLKTEEMDTKPKKIQNQKDDEIEINKEPEQPQCIMNDLVHKKDEIKVNKVECPTINEETKVPQISPKSIQKIGRDLQEFCQLIYQQNTLLQDARSLVFARIRMQINMYLNTDVQVYGSQATGLQLQDSDIDLVILGVCQGYEMVQKQEIIDVMKRLDQLLLSFPWVISSKAILSASIPILKLEIDSSASYDYEYSYNLVYQQQKSQTIQVDITFNTLEAGQHLGIVSTQKVHEWCKAYKSFRCINIFLKCLLRKKGLNNAYCGGISSFCLSIMIAAILQKQSDDPGQALINFLQKFGDDFDLQEDGVNMLQGGFIKREHSLLNPPITIYSPLNSSIISYSTIKAQKLLDEFQSLLNYLRQKQNSTQNLLLQYLEEQ